jgi:hypothetical protein
MYLGKKIWKRLLKYSTELKGNVSDTKLQEQVYKIVKPLGCRIEVVYGKLPKKVHFLIGGEYDPCLTKQPITIFIHLNKIKQGIYFTENRLKAFLFSLSQTIQHELIHKIQCESNRQFYTKEYYYTKGSAKFRFATMSYLATMEEVDAYAHDLAMEICFHYNGNKGVLKNPDMYQQLTTWILYRRAFRHARWIDVRTQLLKKTYKWLPTVKEKFF